LTTLLLDASVWVGARDPEDRFHGSARTLITDFSRRLAALDLTFYEVANTVGARKREFENARYTIELIAKRCGSERVIGASPALMESAVALAADHALSAYDAAYVAAARQNGWTLVSADIRDLVSKGLAVAPDAADYP
jgi:predicted nucleic acid-binding protein